MGEFAIGSITIHIDPVIFHLGPFAPRWYGLMYVVGIVAGVLVARPYANQSGITNEQVETILGPAIIAGLIGGRLYFDVQNLDRMDSLITYFAVWEGGMAFYGAIFGASLAMIITSKLARIPLWPLLDTAAIFAVVGQFFGRIGNVINGDIVGPPTDLPWGFTYTHPGALAFGRELGVAYHPAAIYEMAANVVLFVILWNLRSRLPKPGMLFALYLIGYSLSQFAVFFLRTEPQLLFGLQQAQLTAIFVAYFGLLLLWWTWRKVEPQLAGRH